jgi:hypothetical protein
MVIRIIFNDDDIVLSAESVDFSASCKPEDCPGGILANPRQTVSITWNIIAHFGGVSGGGIRHGVHEVRTSSSGIVPIFEDVCQSPFTVRLHPFRIHSDRDNIHTARPGRLNGIHVCEFFAEYGLAFSNPIAASIPGICEGLDGFRESVCSTASHDDLWTAFVWHIRVQMLADKLPYKREKRWIAIDTAVL